MEILLPNLIFLGLALVAGLLLSIASKVFAVKTDTRVEQAREALPGANCGACGFAGCDEYAAAVIQDETLSVSLCVPGGGDAAAKLGEITGRAAEATTPPVAVVACGGNCESAKTKYTYQGLQSCAAVAMLYGGEKSCSYGCLGFGDCTKVCPQNAITVENGVAAINPALCIGCLACTKVCPKNIIKSMPRTAAYIVSCQNPQKGKDTRAVCTAGCIGCKKCEKTCAHGAVKVTGGLAEINPELCTGCGECAKACPSGCIIAIKPLC